MAASGLSIADAVNSTTNHPYVRGMLSGGLWAASGAASLVANSGDSSARQVVTDGLNIGAGAFSMLATAASGMGDSQTAHTMTSVMSYTSNAAWVGAGTGAMYQGWKTLRDQNASRWKKVSGGFQMLSGLANAGAGLAGIAATAVTEHGEVANQVVEPSYTATALSVASGVMWATGSALGAFSAWAGSGSASQPVQPQRPAITTIQDV
jgi:ATP-dependent protease HslVU (ClpYQ) peptidase subunit